MTVSNDTISFIKKWEKLSLEPYADHKQWSIGYGTYAGPLPGPKPATKLANEAEAHQLLLNDVSKRVGSLKPRLKKPLNQNQFSALVSFAFNAGLQPAYNVINDINSGNIAGATARMLRYVYASGKRLQGLVDRRAAEVKLFNTPVNGNGAPKVANPSTNKVLLSVAIIIIVSVFIFKW